MKANLLSKDFWFVAKELKNQEGFDEVLAFVNKDLLDSQHGVARFRSEFAASMKAEVASMRDNPDWGFSQTAFTEFMLRPLPPNAADPFGTGNSNKGAES